ncbi:serine/threonine-protein kinase [Nannocystis radixulma]|uniref:non-specific serine/threonine protein kinase n=1 Tax=Nannocystis radixulma TaxID=2995305 RepID=A0ABT5AZQ2_9BACT|nr:serine/threonine-protein kinase [Nannocystis radixulma]MDC0666925.1 protein kinase [Nannocystis radixulma]
MVDLEADRLRALMRAAVFKQPHQPVLLGYFEIIKVLGSGAMGIVYEAFDPRRGENVALKTLRAPSARALSLFKREFRALSRLSHPNLVELHKMYRDHDQYFFTMELIRGSPLLTYLWGVEAAPEAPTATPVTDFARLRAVFAQLVDGVFALHQSHKLHRDIKPTNVMVTPEGRVVLMDFGFVGEETVGTLESTAGSLVVGTPAYMAPEQAVGGARTPASDWYSVGATLYMALVGRVPYSGENLARMMERKQQSAPPPPRSLVAGIPDDLDAVCVRLLQPDPKARPAAAELLALFHADRSHLQRVQAAAYLSPAATHVGARSFVGRAAEVRALRLAFDAIEHAPTAAPPPAEGAVEGSPTASGSFASPAASGSARSPTASGSFSTARSGSFSARSPTASGSFSTRTGSVPTTAATGTYGSRTTPAPANAPQAGPPVVLVHGRAGLGKSALVRHVTDGLRQRAAVLRARCYERDTVPYKALDSLVDALARQLRQRDEGEVAAVLPPEIDALVALFPVLHQAPAVAAVTPVPSAIPSRRDLRAALRPDTPAFRALRRLLVGLGGRRPLVLWIDDLQWGDADSVRALAELLRPPEAPRALLIASYRSEDSDSPALRALSVLQDMVEQTGSSIQVVELAPLGPDETDALAEILLGPDTPAQRLQRVAAEAGGSPQLLHELARFVAHGAGSAPEVTLDELIEIRISRLSASQRRLLEVLAVAGRPLAQGVAFAVAGFGSAGNAGLADLHQLQAAGLVRSFTAAGSDLLGEAGDLVLDVQHERAREAVLIRLDGPALRELHGRLAAALERDPQTDPFALIEHLRAAGDTARALALARRAASFFRDAGDFLRAGAFLRVARDLAPPGATPALARELGDTLARAGHSREAAEAYLSARTGGDASGDLALVGAAAAHFITAGHITRGLEVLTRALAAAGVPAGDSSVRSRLGALWRRGQKMVRGLDFTPRAEADVDRRELARVDLCFAAALSTLVVDPSAAADAQARHLLLALRTGETRRVARAFALEACLLAPGGASARTQLDPILASARALARSSGAAGIADLCDLVDLLTETAGGDPARALSLAGPLLRAGTLHAPELPGVSTLARLCQFRALLHLGRYDLLNDEVPALLTSARFADDRAALVACGSLAAWLAASAGEPEEAQALAAECAVSWPAADGREFHLQHLQILGAHAHALLAAGDAAAAWAHVEAAAPALTRSGLGRVQPLRTQATELTGRTALAALAAGPPGSAREGLRRAVERAADALQRDNAGGHAALMRAGLRRLAGDVAGAQNLLQTASDAFAAAGMAAHRAAAALRQAQLAGRGDSEPRRLLEDLGVFRPDCFATLLAPALNK